MSRRLTAAVMLVVLAMQALVFAPASFASALGSSSTSSAGHCADSGKDQRCPCCPHGMSADCMTVCAACPIQSEMAAPSLRVPAAAVIPFSAPASITQTYVPLNPPPIA